MSETGEQPVDTKFGQHVETFLDYLAGLGTADLANFRSSHEHGKDLGNRALEFGLSVHGLGFDQTQGRGTIDISDFNYREYDYQTMRVPPWKQVHINYSLKDGKSHVESMFFPYNQHPSKESDLEFLRRIGPQLDVMVQKGKEIRQQAKSPQE